jgi:8-oxo-dGTP diphosphatase
MPEFILSHECPFLAFDIIIEVGDSVVVIERKNPPHGLALVGGFVDYGETVETAAKRESMEEVGMDIHNLRLVGVYSDPKRDKRGHIVTIAFLAEAEGEPKAADDAKDAFLMPWGEIMNTDLIADHLRIVLDAFGKYKVY